MLLVIVVYLFPYCDTGRLSDFQYHTRQHTCLCCLPSVSQVMLKSMVSGGYWLSSGTGLAKFLQVASFVTFTCDDTTRPVGAFKHNQVRCRLTALLLVQELQYPTLLCWQQLQCR
jgi:hypothetical protein